MSTVALTRQLVHGEVRLFERPRSGEELDLIELAENLRSRRAADPTLTVAALARELGRSSPWVSNVQRLLKLTSAGQELVRDGRLSFAHARLIVNLSESDQLALIRDVLSNRISAHELERRVRRLRPQRASRLHLVRQTSRGPCR